jgi:hypothetical protein
MVRNYTICLPEKIQAQGTKMAKKEHKSFSEYIKDLIIEDLKKEK